MCFTKLTIGVCSNKNVMHSLKLWINVSIMLLLPNKSLTTFLKWKNQSLGFVFLFAKLKYTYAFLINQLRCWESCCQRKKSLTVFALPFRRYIRLYGHIEHRIVRPLKVRYLPGMRSRDIFGRLRLRLRLWGSISVPAPRKTVRRLRLRLRLRAKCTGSGSGSGSNDQVLM